MSGNWRMRFNFSLACNLTYLEVDVSLYIISIMVLSNSELFELSKMYLYVY